jgi:glycerol-3-phosphate dehydrogenase
MGLDVPLATIRHLIAKYAETAAAVIRLTGDRPDLRESVALDSRTLAAEIVYAIRHEQAMRLTDVVMRRTGLGAMDCPDDIALRASAKTAATELGWDETRTEAEIELVRAGYRVK